MSTIWSSSAGLTPAPGSSSSTILGSATITRASSSNLRWPPDRMRAGSCARLDRPTKSNQCRAAASVWRSCRATRAGRSQLVQKRSPIWPRGATITFSSTLISGNGRGIWKVLAKPAANTALEGRPEMRTPSSSTLPDEAGMKPVRQLNSVVLPAPLGPIKPPMTPAFKANETWLTAWWPPKFLDRASTTSSPSSGNLSVFAGIGPAMAGQAAPAATTASASISTR